MESRHVFSSGTMYVELLLATAKESMLNIDSFWISKFADYI
jgi:hypothetical protein